MHNFASNMYAMMFVTNGNGNGNAVGIPILVLNNGFHIHK